MSDIKYEPTREHWKPYEPWMRDGLADDARTSYHNGRFEVRREWKDFLPGDHVSSGLRIHPDDVPERPAEEHPDEALAKVLYEALWRTPYEYDEPSKGWLKVARAAREHIEGEREEGGYNIRRAERERERRVKAEADVERHSETADRWCRFYADETEKTKRLTRERDEARDALDILVKRQTDDQSKIERLTRERDEAEARYAIMDRRWRDRYRALRAGIEALCSRWRGSTNPALHMERDLRALLNPTEGETDHE